jgi:hypothetical protein
MRRALLLVLTIVMGACALSPPTIAVPTQQPVPANGTPPPCAAAITEGDLVAHEEWGIALNDHDTGGIRRVIWPHGFSARQDGDGLALLDASGAVVARVGDHVRIGGGESGAESWIACGNITVVAS